ncbi:hypothetical protein ABG067_006722 [Albugo candida]|uniref:Iron-sulfur cluster assembly protein n=1 Tax=Albugo candida TaxID=65357 RepID=A0A024GP90_9STRA|nr:unnamed protein product [Albugo candida]|eukprot:CCI48707.1 unnamed protein product [Albugo candida]
MSRQLLKHSQQTLALSAATTLRNSTGIAINTIQQRQYHENVIDHYENPRNVGSLDKAAKDVGTGLVGAPACGDVMKLQIKVDENGKIVDSKFKTFGCGSAIASSSVATEWLKGRTVDECISIKNTDIASHLKLPPVKLHCSMLAEDAIKAAIKDYKKKQTA